ncbi:hypothetical protein GCM10023258_11480 [Terrabacter aeriphilus]|uniref:Uncharacterized protein n=1 Tax=Terrabacter aeriphilus TaxID=515662 RepID=A0ABP9J7F0_9MICO
MPERGERDVVAVTGPVEQPGVAHPVELELEGLLAVDAVDVLGVLEVLSGLEVDGLDRRARR